MNAKRWDRRDFVRAGLLGGGAALGAAGAEAAPKPVEAPAKPKVRYRTLGRTKLKVSEVSFGSYGFTASEVFDAALNAGINLIATAGPYQEGKAEAAIGQVLKKRRKDAVVMTGWMMPKNITKEKILDELDKSLQRLQTDQIEIMRAHMAGEPEEILNPAIFEALDEAKKAKKARFLGLSSHNMRNLDQLIEAAIDSKKYDVLMFRYNIIEGSQTEKLIARAAKEQIGVLAFKVGAGKRETDSPRFATEGLTLEQARVRWALKNPGVTSVIHAFNTFEDVKNVLPVMERGLTTEEAMLLEDYKRQFAHEYCRYCGACEGACPAGVSVSEVMRYHMYYKYYGREKDSMELYARLDPARRASACDDCPGWCERACPNAVRVHKQLVEAHRLLSFMA